MKIASFYSIILLLILAGCSDPITIGGDILGPDQAPLQVVDTFTIRTATVAEEDLVVFSPNVQFATNLCGHLDDQVFGDVKADFFAQFEVNENFLPLFTDSTTFDSLILVLEYDLDGFYGDFTAPQEFEIFRIREPNLTTGDSTTFISGNPVFVTDPDPIMTVQFVPNIMEQIDSNTVVSIDNSVTPPVTTFGTLSPFFRLRLDEEDDFIPDLISAVDGLIGIHNDGNDQNNEDFLREFGGLAIKPVGGPTGSMLNFNTLSLNSGLFLYFTNGSNPLSFRYQYNTKTSSVRFTSFTNNQDSEIVNAIDNGFEGGEVETYVQGMDGPNTLIQLPFITEFKDEVLVNNAELTVTIQSTPDDPNEVFFPPVEQIIVSYQTEEGDFITIEDFIFAFNGLGLEFFGGQPEVFTTPDGQTMSRYRMNIGGHLQRMIDGDLPNELFLQVFQKNERASRVILFGSDHPEFPVTLTANFTKLN